jgi:hypothetical protein
MHRRSFLPVDVNAAATFGAPLAPLVPFSLHESHGKSIKWAAEETEVSSSNFIFSAKDIVCYPRVPSAEK